MAEDDDRPGDASSAANASWADVVVPDDISSLVADVDAYRREVRRNRRRAWQARVMSRPGILPLSIVSVALLLAGLVATLLTVLAPSQGASRTSALPLATSQLKANGQLGGLLPQVSLRSDGQTVGSPTLRPAVVALVPVGCNCASLLNNLAGRADEVGYQFDAVAPSVDDAKSLQSAVTQGRARVYNDPNLPAHPADSLAGQMKAAGLTLVLVQRDGRIHLIYSQVQSVPPHIDAQLQTMQSSQASG